jgi:hypothetical protein
MEGETERDRQREEKCRNALSLLIFKASISVLLRKFNILISRTL